MDEGLQIKELAAQLGCDGQSLSYWEHGRWVPSLRQLPAVINWLGYDLRPSSETLGAQIRRYRTARGLSTRELAEKLAVDPSTIEAWERNEHRPGRRLGARLVAFFNDDESGGFATE